MAPPANHGTTIGPMAECQRGKAEPETLIACLTPR